MQLETLTLQIEGDELYRRGKINEACQKWSKAADLFEKNGKQNVAKDLRERIETILKGKNS